MLLVQQQVAKNQKLSDYIQLLILSKTDYSGLHIGIHGQLVNSIYRFDTDIFDFKALCLLI